MISRYTRPELAALWSESRRLALFLEVELAATAALEEAQSSPIPTGTAMRLRQLSAQMGPLDPSRVSEIERRTQHEVLAFLEHVEERLGPEARWLHFGLTSSDVLDTVLALQLREATSIIIRGIDEQLLPALRRQATAHQQTPMIGRTHGIFAEPIAAGLVFLGSYAEIERAKARIQRAQRAIAVGKLSGAVGVYGSGCVTPDVEEKALSSLGLVAETVATQVVARDRHAELLWSLSMLGAAVERLAVNLRHLQRSEVSEVEEAFAPGQKGSSAMPHKKNPISAENLCGLARLLRANAHAAVENIALWHERDISHSSVERVIMPDSTTLCDYMVQRAAKLVFGLSVRTGQMDRNLAQSGDLYASEKVMLQLVRSGLSRQSAYELVQRHALACVAERGSADAPSFQARLAADPQIADRLPTSVLAACFEIATQLQHVPQIFARTLAD
ncbi:MAG TPA: adenylosuccinate lyase [Pseudomonadota bacterium]|jgi:adenylosuccinate lyase|nr:adenylosuccinate lyase [Pseudomonadota bacterium]HNK44644.1 adenylosuccinate lyase [Pseudomonadota bacterium]HNN52095.1 adenylosuccinate lyase [Pseudomonadota bacterium]